MASGFAPPAPPPAPRIESVNMPSAPTPDTVAAFHTRLIESLLAQLRSIARVKSTAALSPLIDAFKDVDTWSSLQTLLRAKLGAPGTKLLQGDADTLRQSGQAILFVLERIGAKKLVEACLAIDEQTVDAPASSSISRADHSWQGLCELMAWLSAVRSALLGEVTPSAQPTAAISSTAVETSPAESTAPVSPPVIKPEPVSASVGFAPPPRAGALAKEQDEKRARLSAANPPVAAAASVPTEANSRMATSTSPPVASSASATSTAPAGSKAAAFAMRMSAMSGSAVASTSAALPSGPPSAGFAPPPGPGASAFDKKPKASAPRKPRASAPPAAVVEAAQAQMDEAPRAKRERKSSVKVRETSAGDERDEATRFKAGSNGKKRFTSYDDPSDSDGVADDAELDELASDYEEQLERKRRRLEGLQSDGSTSRRASGGGNRKPRDPAAERERQLAIIAKEEAELAKDPKRFKVGEAVIARFPNYSYWPAVVLDGTTAPPKTQGKREKGSYLVKSIPTGGDHRWVPPDDSSILAVTTTQLDDIILGRYKSAPPPSWKKWRGELVDAAMMIKDEERLKEWFSHPTPTEVWQMAQAERKKAARASAAW